MNQNLTVNLTEPSEVVLGHCADKIAGLIIWGTVSIFCSLVGCPACVAVFWVLFQRHKPNTPITPNVFFMLNLTIMDFIFLFSFPFMLCNVLVWKVTAFSQFTNFLYALNLVGRPLLTACLCLDCYMAVVHAVAYRMRKSLTLQVAMAAVVWIITAVQGSLSVFMVELYHSPWAVFVYIVALPVIVFCNVSVLRALKKSYRAGGGLHPWKKKALHITVSSMIMLLTSYLPPVLAYVLGYYIIQDKRVYECYLAIPIETTSTAGSVTMSVLYLGHLESQKSRA